MTVCWKRSSVRLSSSPWPPPRGNQVRAAEILGLNRNTLRKKIQDLGVEMNRGRR